VSRIYDLIKRKRDGGRLGGAEIRAFIDGVTKGSVPDYQAAALLMAVFFRGLDEKELAAWTQAMLQSGEILDLSDIKGVKVDKHSTGGVGDKVSISLAPLVACLGVPVPMISGRGLGHTGGTLDKLEAIPGFRVDLPADRFARQVRRIGLAMIGQTGELAPADRKLYALRDVTATVESIPLIAASIMSKKLAAGIDGLVLDVKVGAGAFMKTLPDARQLARTLVSIGRHAGKDVIALLTAMDQPLGLAVGNALETAEAIKLLHGDAPADLVTVTLELGARMLVIGGKARDRDSGLRKLERVIQSGRALQKLRAMVEAQGGDPRVVDDPDLLPRAPVQTSVKAPRAGYVQAIDAEAVGVAAMMLGAGRAKAEDKVDPAVGILLRRKVGARVRRGDDLATLYGNGEGPLADSARRVVAAYTIDREEPPARPLVLDEIRG
jgi:pyrimidine-nucleoside phosphorylase